MATIKFCNAAGKYADDDARQTVLAYITQPRKTPSHLIGGVGVDLNDMADSFKRVADYFNKDRQIRIRHFIVSFMIGEIKNINQIRAIAHDICIMIGTKYQVVYAVHEDTAILHIHFVQNSVSFADGYKFHGSKSDHKELIAGIRHIVQRHGINVLYEVKYRPEQYGQYE